MLINSFVWSPSKFACTVEIRTTIYTCLALLLTVWPLACLSPCTKPLRAPLCVSIQEFNTKDSHSACPYQQGSDTTGTQHTNSNTNSTTPPQSFTVIMSLLGFSSFYDVPPTKREFFGPISSFPTSFLWESQRAASEPSVLQENFTAHLLYEHLFESYSPRTFEDGLFYSGDTS